MAEKVRGGIFRVIVAGQDDGRDGGPSRRLACSGSPFRPHWAMRARIAAGSPHLGGERLAGEESGQVLHVVATWLRARRGGGRGGRCRRPGRDRFHAASMLGAGTKANRGPVVGVGAAPWLRVTVDHAARTFSSGQPSAAAIVFAPAAWRSIAATRMPLRTGSKGRIPSALGVSKVNAAKGIAGGSAPFR